MSIFPSCPECSKGAKRQHCGNSSLHEASSGRSLLNGKACPARSAAVFADVRSWHLADIDADDEHVCFWR